MTKKLSNTKQISILKRLRRACPFAVFSGSYGYTCGGMVGGGTFFFGHGSTFKGSSSLYALLLRLAKGCFHAGLRHHTSNSQDKRLWLRH